MGRAPLIRLLRYAEEENLSETENVFLPPSLSSGKKTVSTQSIRRWVTMHTRLSYFTKCNSLLLS